MDTRRHLVAIALGAALVAGHAAKAGAIVAPDPNGARPEPGIVRVCAPARDRKQVEQLVEGALGDLQQAAHESDPSSQRVSALLQAAQDKLTRAMDPLAGARWARINRLVADIDRELDRASAQADGLLSSGAGSRLSGQRLRADLAALARQAQALAGPTWARRIAPDTDDLAQG